MRISSTEELSKELVGILSARDLNELKTAISKHEDYWISVFRVLDSCDFSHLYKYHTFSHTSSYSFISLSTALSLIQNFDNGSLAYGNKEKQERKFKQLLSALSFLDSDIFVTFVLKRFRWDAVKEFLKEREEENE